MNFFKNYKYMSIVFGAIVIIFGIMSVIFFPKKSVVPESDYTTVNVTVTDIQEKNTGTSSHPRKNYITTVEYDNQKYTLAATSANLYKKNMTYEMFLYNGNIYATVNDINKADLTNNAPSALRFTTILTFVSAIIFIGYLSAYLQQKKKKSA